MDFLTLFAIYVAVVLSCIVLVCRYSGQQQTPFTILIDSVGRVRVVAFACNSKKTSLYGAVGLFYHHTKTLYGLQLKLLTFLFTGDRTLNTQMAPKAFPGDPAPTVSSKVCSCQK